MNFAHSTSSSKTTHPKPAKTPPTVPRLTSLQHRLQHARDADGRPIPLLDELLFFLDDPPPGTRDRWQEGADLCQKHGISTSRMAVWRFYRAHILHWRREQDPAPPDRPSDPKETARLQDHARHLAAQRAIEILNDPRLSPGHLIGLIQNDICRQHNQLARDQFNDRLAARQRAEQTQHLQRIDDEMRKKALFPAQMEFNRKLVATLLSVPPHTTP
jgi:hypothetical protein